MVIIDYDGPCRGVLTPGARIDGAASPAASNPLFLVSLAHRAKLTIGIDSGPSHLFQACASAAAPADCDGRPAVAGLPSPLAGEGSGVRASAVQSIIYWHRHHAVNYSDAPDNPHVLHLVPANHGTWIKGDRPTGEAYFAAHYRHRIYTDPGRDLAAAINALLRFYR